MAQQWNTVHIFGYGESQAIGDGYNKKVDTINLESAQEVIDEIYSKKPKDSNASAEYHAINIFNGIFADYQPKEGDSFRVNFDELDATLIDSLVEEIVDEGTLV